MANNATIGVRSSPSGGALARLLVSSIIVAILALQAVAGFGNTGRWGWPLVPYGMYRTAHYEGERIDHDLATYAVLADSSRVEIKRSDLGWSFWIYWYNVVRPVREGNLAALQPVLRRYCEESDNQVTRLVVEDLGIAIGRDGPIEGLAPEIMYETDVTCP